MVECPFEGKSGEFTINRNVNKAMMAYANMRDSGTDYTVNIVRID